MIGVVVFDIVYWVFLNSLPEWLITVNSKPMPLVANHLTPYMLLIGFAVSLLPVSMLFYSLYNIRKLFSFYSAGVIFSNAHTWIFRRLAKTFMFLVLFSMIYESAKSVLFSFGNPAGSRVLEIGFSSNDFFMLLMGGIIWVISWVVDEGRVISEENNLTV
jgi:hypothetical protein